MVIASALPVPRSPVSRVAVATTEPSSLPLRERDEQPTSLVLPVKHRAPGNVLDVVPDADAALQENTAHVQGSLGGRTSSPGTQRPQTDLDYLSHGRTLRTEELSMAPSQSKDRTDPNSRHQHLASVDFSSPDHLLDSVAQMQHDPGSAPQDKQRTTVTSEAAAHSSPPGTGPLFSSGRKDQNLNQEAGLSLDSIFDQDEMFLDIHPRVLFSTSSSPPKHPPLLLMLESGLLEEQGTRTGPLRVREIGPLTEAPPRSPRKLCGPEGINGRFCWTGGGGSCRCASRRASGRTSRRRSIRSAAT
eukprot:XP_011602645.1 PREDICTED: uncharacterized protein LOC101069363 [Takifugu rubripes]